MSGLRAHWRRRPHRPGLPPLRRPRARRGGGGGGQRPDATAWRTDPTAAPTVAGDRGGGGSMNSLFALIPIAFVLSLDNFQSSIGLGTTQPPWRRIVQAALVFSACDALGEYIGDAAEYAGAAALGAYALYLVVQSMRTEETKELDHPLAILGLPLPLSLDNLIAGASLGVVGASPVTVAVVCGAATLIMSLVGLTLGKLVSSKVRIRTDLFGGLVMGGLALLMVVRAG